MNNKMERLLSVRKELLYQRDNWNKDANKYLELTNDEIDIIIGYTNNLYGKIHLSSLKIVIELIRLLVLTQWLTRKGNS